MDKWPTAQTSSLVWSNITFFSFHNSWPEQFRYGQNKFGTAAPSNILNFASCGCWRFGVRKGRDLAPSGLSVYYWPKRSDVCIYHDWTQRNEGFEHNEQNKNTTTWWQELEPRKSNLLCSSFHTKQWKYASSRSNIHINFVLYVFGVAFYELLVRFSARLVLQHQLVNWDVWRRKRNNRPKMNRVSCPFSCLKGTNPEKKWSLVSLREPKLWTSWDQLFEAWITFPEENDKIK